MLAKNARTLQILGAFDMKNIDIQAIVYSPSYCAHFKTVFDFKLVNWKLLQLITSFVKLIHSPRLKIL